MSTSISMDGRKREVKSSKIKRLNEEILEDRKRDYENTFGNIESFESMFQRIQDDPEDIKEYQRERQAQGKTLGQYIKEIRSHLDNFDYKNAIKVLEVDMVNDRIRGNVYVYKALINYNARIGNLEEAYRLFINFKKRQGIATGAMYTSLFNACANCKSSFLALEKADAVSECMRNNKNHVINISNYNAMMKAYGRHGDIATCLKIMDEVLYKRDKVHISTYNFLLQACISDKNSGLRHALMVWRKMLQVRVKPSIHSFNLMLRCVRDCSLGDHLLIPNLIEEIQKESGKFFRRKVKIETIHNEKKRTVLKIPSTGMDLIKPVEKEVFQSRDKTTEHLTIEAENVRPDETDEAQFDNCKMLSNDSSVNGGLSGQTNQSDVKENDSSRSGEIFSIVEPAVNEKEHCNDNLEVNVLHHGSELPNFIALQPSMGSVVKFNVMTEPHHRFMLVGSTKGFLKTMAEFEVKPEVKTFTLMLEVIPSTLEAEKEVLSMAEAHQVPLDTGFFNVLIKRRILRNDDLAVKDCLQQMHTLNLRPDLLTFGILALGCRTLESAEELLWNVKNAGYRVNEEILGAMLKRAMSDKDLNYVSAILKAAKENETQLSQKFLAILDKFVKREQWHRRKEANKRIMSSSASLALKECEAADPPPSS